MLLFSNKPRRSSRRLASAAAIAGALVVSAVSAPTIANAQSTATSLDHQAAMVIKAISFDRNLGHRAGKKFVLAVLNRPFVVDSLRCAIENHAAFSAFSGRVIQGSEIEVHRVSLSPGEHAMPPLIALEADGVYVCTGMLDLLDEIKAYAVDYGALTMAPNLDMVTRGVVIGTFRPEGQRARMVINQTSAFEVGASFAATLLQYVQIID